MTKDHKNETGHTEKTLHFLDDNGVTVGTATFTEIKGSWYFERFATCN